MCAAPVAPANKTSIMYGGATRRRRVRVVLVGRGGLFFETLRRNVVTDPEIKEKHPRTHVMR